MMTKADFEAIAEALNTALYKNGNDPLTVMSCTAFVAAACQKRSKNDSFDGARFLRAVTKETHVPLTGAS